MKQTKFNSDFFSGSITIARQHINQTTEFHVHKKA